eukprot:750120-Hanusia_phi.AAC.3
MKSQTHPSGCKLPTDPQAPPVRESPPPPPRQEQLQETTAGGLQLISCSPHARQACRSAEVHQRPEATADVSSQCGEQRRGRRRDEREEGRGRG